MEQEKNILERLSEREIFSIQEEIKEKVKVCQSLELDSTQTVQTCGKEQDMENNKINQEILDNVVRFDDYSNMFRIKQKEIEEEKEQQQMNAQLLPNSAESSENKDQIESLQKEQNMKDMKDKPKKERKKKEKKQIEYEQNIKLEKQVEETDINKLLDKSKSIFPHPQLYFVQSVSMERILESLLKKQNLLFQSPTGTGKTLITICSALSFIESRPNTQILLLTRTNEQINGFIKEIRQIKSYPSINKYAILSGRGQFCLLQEQFQKQQKENDLEEKDFNQDQSQHCENDLKVKNQNQDLQKFCKKMTEQKDQKKENEQNENQPGPEQDNQDNNNEGRQMNQFELREQLQNDKMVQDKQFIEMQQDKIHVGNDKHLQSNASNQPQIEGFQENLAPQQQIDQNNQDDFDSIIKLITDEKSEDNPNPKKIELDSNYQSNKVGFVCPHYKNYERIKAQIQYNREKYQKELEFNYPHIRYDSDGDYVLPDIEDIKSLFEQKGIGCPFFINKLAVRSAKIIFSTYNYVIKQNILSNVKHLLQKNLIIIFDEAHNIPDQAEQEQKEQLKSEHWKQLIGTLDQMQKVFSKNQNSFNKTKIIKDMIQQDIQNEIQYFKDKLIDKSEQQQKQVSGDNKLLAREIFDEDKEENNLFYKYKEQHLNIYDLVSNKFISDKIPENCTQTQKRILDFIKITKNPDDVFNQQMEEIFNLYQDLRQKEVFSFLDNIQNDFLSIKEDCEGFDQFFNQNNSRIQLSCDIFNDDKILKHFEKLNIDNLNTQQFLDRLQKIYHTLSYVKQVIISQNKDKEQPKKKKHVNVTVFEGRKLQESNIRTMISEFDNTMDSQFIKFIQDSIQINFIPKIWSFNFKLLKLWKEKQLQANPKYLQNHYLSVLRDKKQDSSPPLLEIGCLSASIIFENISKKLKVNSFILASGTLEPFELIEKSIGLKFEKHSSQHLVNPKTNLFTQFISKCNKNENQISFSKSEGDKLNEDSLKIVESIIMPLIEYTERVKQKCGVVIFFKNYSKLNQYSWPIEKSYSKKNINVYTEVAVGKGFYQEFQQYKQDILQNQKNSIFLAVHRGKLSEGIDLKDNLCRAVILLGVPYPKLDDPYIVCKRQHAALYLKENYWYDKVTVKTVNQAAGRCIRYKQDWGCVFFVDKQYITHNIRNNISSWILQGQKVYGYHSYEKWQQSYKKFLEQKK